MESEWRAYQLKELGRVITGRTPSEKNPEHWGEYLPFVTPSDMDGRRIIDQPTRYLSESGAEAFAKNIIPYGVGVSCIGWQMGKTILIDKPCVTNQQINAIITNPRLVDSSFLYYTLSSRRDEIFRLGIGGSRTPILNKSDFEKIVVYLPSLEEQRTIAHILGSLDDKIELNRRMNATLEATARAIFQSWFVDFDPVHAKARGEQPFGMDAEIAALFPDSFEDSELGMIPTGWRVGMVGDEFALTMGQSPPGETYNEEGEGLPFYQGRRDFGFRYPTRRIYCTEPTRIAEQGDTLVSVRAPVGDINMALERCCVGRGVASVRHKSTSRSYTYYAISNLHSYFDNYNGEGTVFGSINGADFRKIPVIVPSREVVTAFEQVTFALDESIEINEQQISTLADARDALLPKLISGELRVEVNR